MSREIKFRGKRIDNGEWAYGYYAVHKMMLTGEMDYFIIVNEQRPQSIDPETVGQYTGLKDKNGIEIYEDDIVKGKDDCDDRIIGEVQYRVTRFSVNGVKQYTFNQCSLNRQFEIIGNRYENPELLKGEDKHETNS